MARLTEAQVGGANVLRFLDLIAFSEGTSTVKGSDDGYNVLYGGGLFTGYQDHPRQKLTFPINGKPVTSTAAGRYQILARYWDAYRVSLRLQGGFTPENQDRVALQQIRERRALDDIKSGRIADAIEAEYDALVAGVEPDYTILDGGSRGNKREIPAVGIKSTHAAMAIWHRKAAR